MKSKNEDSEITEKLIELEVIKEDWNVYELEDGSIIKQKILLSFFIETNEKDAQGNTKFWISNNQVTAVYSPISIRGPPDRNYSVPELEKYVEQPNMKFSLIHDGGRNQYKTEKFLITVNYLAKKIEKTSKYDSKGMPAYIVRNEIEMLISEVLPEKVNSKE